MSTPGRVTVAQASGSFMAEYTVDQQRQYCLHKACAAGDLDTVKRLINEGASINHSTPLYEALRGNPTSSWSRGGTPKLEVARYLIEHGADVNFERSRLLVNFCETGPWEVVEFLLLHGAEANVAALANACGGRWRSVELCQLLLDHGAPVDPVEEGGHAPLFYACINFTSTPDHLPLAAFLLDRGADVNREAYLESACAACDVAIARLLLDRGADADHKHHGATPLESTRNRAVHHPGKNWAALVALLEAAPPARVRSRTHWRRRILFHVVGRRAANPGSKRHELGLYRVSTIASFLM